MDVITMLPSGHIYMELIYCCLKCNQIKENLHIIHFIFFYFIQALISFLSVCVRINH